MSLKKPQMRVVMRAIPFGPFVRGRDRDTSEYWFGQIALFGNYEYGEKDEIKEIARQRLQRLSLY